MSLVTAERRRLALPAAEIVRFGIPIALGLVLVAFSAAAPGFLTVANVTGVLVNNVALAAIVAIAMTLAVAAGGTDLSVGTAVDLGSLAFITAIGAGQPVALAGLYGLLAGIGTGLFNALLIARLSITPFLATLGTLFIGHSLQQLTTDGGNPVYVPADRIPAALAILGHGSVLGVPLALWLVLIFGVGAWLLLARTRFGREVLAVGTQVEVAIHSGLPVRRILTLVYVASAAIAALAGILLSAHVNAYVPYAGNAYLLDSIGAAFIGTSLSRNRRPNIPGTILGVVLFAFVTNGLLLVGWNFYWQQVGTGVLIFLTLAFAFAGPRPHV
ncbi:ABC transporter permease [Methylobacterium pseudosasicola]|uniref:Monosaccharide ABC transporter membrane protein, CUT2 family n=1 Tax=Methylobacterium pseudosasicola TaxID=582667 RepID=A0A1I4HCV5_9HYPH|nr:ABC transporter permease [Methylobacterium pseudosasicola]SFL39437.1 monosaccharide ABC transporter membrane protein, CUT2 family [Methylobacterium pseudosasicola]